jgi:hypothetical protein
LFLAMFPPLLPPSSSPTPLDPRHHRPCRPHPLLHRRCRRSSATTLVTIAIALTALFVTALIIGFRCCSSPAAVLVYTARLRKSRR